MPLFEFHCPACKHSLEKLLKAPVDKFPCPICGQRVSQVVSTPAASGAGCPTAAGSGFR